MNYIIDLFDSFFLEFFINGLKEAIHSHVIIQWPSTWLEAYDKVRDDEMVIDVEPKFHSFTTYMRSPIATTSNNFSTPLLHIQKLTSYAMKEH